MSAEVIPPYSNDEDDLRGKVAVIMSGKKPEAEVYNPDPNNLPKELAPGIRYAIFHAVNDSMITSREARDWVAEMKERNPDSHVVCDETITYTIEATESQSLLGKIFSLNPNVGLRFIKSTRTHPEID